jgi:hypothetical protein
MSTVRVNAHTAAFALRRSVISENVGILRTSVERPASRTQTYTPAWVSGRFGKKVSFTRLPVDIHLGMSAATMAQTSAENACKQPAMP